MSTRGADDTMLAMTGAIKTDLARAVVIGVAIEFAIWLLIRINAAQRWEDWWYLITGFFWNDDRLPLARWLNALQRPFEVVFRYVYSALYGHLNSTLPSRRSWLFFGYIGLASAIVIEALIWTAATFIVLRLLAVIERLSDPRSRRPRPDSRHSGR